MPLLHLLTGIYSSHVFKYFPILVSIALGTAALILLSRRRFLALFLILTGFFYASLRHPDNPLTEGNTIEAELSGVFCSDGIRRSDEGVYSQGFKIYNARKISSNEDISIYPEVINIYSEKPFEHGRKYRIRAALRLPQPEFSLQPAPYARLIEVLEEGGLSPIESLRARINRFFIKRFDPDSAALMMALTTGERAGMSYEMLNAFNRSGLTHLLSISGTHFGLLLLLFFGLFRLLIGILPYTALERLTVYVSPGQAAALLTLPFMLFYFFLSGGSLPALRSFIMIGLFLIGLLVGRKRLWLRSVLFAATTIALWEPKAVLDISFLMSFGAVLFIGFLTEVKKTDLKTIKKYPLYATLTSLAASAGILPFIAYFFHRVSLIAPVANLIVTPLAGFVLLPVSLIFGLMAGFSDWFSESAIVKAVSPISQMSVYLVKFFSSVPYAEVKVAAFPIFLVVLYYLCFAMYFVTRKRYVFVPLLIIALYAYNASASLRPLRVVFLPAEGGDSSVVELPDGRTIIIDTGKTGRHTASYLTYSGKDSIDALVISHNHIDHAGGIKYLSSRFRINEIWSNGQEIPDAPDGMPVRYLRCGDYTATNRYSISVLHPCDEYPPVGDPDKYKNNSSLVLKIKGINTFLYTGDIEKEAMSDIAVLREKLKSDVLKVPHHGLKSSLQPEFLTAVAPSVAVVTAKKINPDMRQALGNADVYLTEIDGPIKIEDSKEGPAVRKYSDYRLKEPKTAVEEIANLKRLFSVW